MQRPHIEPPEAISQVAPTTLSTTHPAHEPVPDLSKSTGFLKMRTQRRLVSTRYKRKQSGCLRYFFVLACARTHSLFVSRGLLTPSQSVNCTAVDDDHSCRRQSMTTMHASQVIKDTTAAGLEKIRPQLVLARPHGIMQPHLVRRPLRAAETISRDGNI